MPDFTLEDKVRTMHGGRVAGVDEAGRGPWAGPVVAAAVILDDDRVVDGLNDSKLLSEDTREALCNAIFANSMIGIGIVEVATIDRVNILQASLLAMRRAVDDLPAPPQSALIDGNRAPALACPAITCVRGDSNSASIAAASIIAKVTRDRVMRRLDADLPAYGWARNKGYGTAEHAAALLRHGVTVHHRRSFAPVADALRKVGVVAGGAG